MEIIFFENEKGSNCLLVDNNTNKDSLNEYLNKEKNKNIERYEITKETYDLMKRMQEISLEHAYYFEKLTEFLKDANDNKLEEDYYYDGRCLRVSSIDSEGILCNENIKSFIDNYEQKKSKAENEIIKSFINVAKNLKE